MAEVIETKDLIYALTECAKWDKLSPEIQHAFKKLAERLKPLDCY